MEEKLYATGTDDLQKLVDEAVKNAKLKETTHGGKDALVKDGELKAVEKALSDRIYGRIIDAGYWRPAVGSSYYRPNYAPWAQHPMGAGLYGDIHQVLGLNDFINRYEVENRVMGHVLDPALTEILGVMYDIINKKDAKGGDKKEEAKGGDKKAEEKPAADAKKAALSQKDKKVNLMVQNSMNEAMAKLQGTSDDGLQKMVDAAIANAKNKPAGEVEAEKKEGEMRAVEKILADKIYNRIIADGYYRPPYTSSYYRPYYGPYRGPLNSGLTYDINRLLNYHEYVNRYDVVNKVVGSVLDPKLEEIIGVLYDLVNGKKDGKDGKKEEAKGDDKKEAAAAKPEAKALMQLQEGGVPVLVDPSLMKNTMSYTDLSQRDYIIDGLNGIDFVQTNNLENEDLVVLHVNGEPRGIDTEEVLLQIGNPTENPPMNNWSVNQPSPPHAKGLAGKTDLGLRDLTIDGVDGFDLVQTSNPTENPPMNNWSVNQPSPPHAQGRPGKENLDLDLIVRGHKISIA